MSCSVVVSGTLSAIFLLFSSNSDAQTQPRVVVACYTNVNSFQVVMHWGLFIKNN